MALKDKKAINRESQVGLVPERQDKDEERLARPKHWALARDLALQRQRVPQVCFI